MISFEKVRWKNFLSTGATFTEINLTKSPNTLIIGNNGAGKSTILDALCFGLFGKPFRKINKPQLLNSINKQQCVVEIEFNIGKKEYKIVRGMKPNVFEIHCDKVLLNQDAAAKDYQEILEKQILKLNYKSFTQIVILGSASFTPFMQLSPADRRAIIEDLLDIQIFSTMNQVVKDKLSENKDLLTQSKHEIVLTQQKYDLQKKYIDEQKQNNDEKVRQYAQEIESNHSVVQTLHEEIGGLTQTVSDLTEQVRSKSEIETKVKKLGKLESQIESNLSKFRRDIRFFETNDSCPTCRQAIALEFKETELTGLTDKVQKCEHGLSELEQKIIEEQNRLNTIAEIQTQIQTLQVEIATKNTTITETNRLISRLNGLIAELNTAGVATGNEEIQLTQLVESLDALQEKLKELINEKTYYEFSATLLKDTGIKTKIIKQYLPIINKLVNKYLSALDFFVKFEMNENFEESIKSRHRDDFSYANFSEGEKMRIDLALLFTWRQIAKLKNSTNTNLLILDEVFDSSLDAVGTEEFLKLMNEMGHDTNIFIISHKGDQLFDKFRSVIKFEKKNNFSQVTR